jgi:hypothetical protein
MKVVNNRRRSNPFVVQKFPGEWRDNSPTVMGTVGHVLFLSGSLSNPNLRYQLITEQLSQGTHKFGIKTYDDLDNVSGIQEGSISIADYRNFPRFVFGGATGNTIKIKWTESVEGAPDNYLIYSNNGSGVIDRTTPLYVLAGTLNTYQFEVADGNWQFVVEALKNGVESVNQFVVVVDTPSSTISPPSVTDLANSELSIMAVNASVGKIRVGFIYPYGSVTKYFRLYHDGGTGTVSYGSFTQFTKATGFLQDFTTEQVYFGSANATFIFVLRAVSVDGVEETNTTEHEVLLDGVPPDDITELTIGSTF